MRITGGNLKGFRIPARFASHVRPTTDMMREAVFNKLQHTVGIEEKSVLDLFTGSGLIALEFISRDAGTVTAVDRDVKNIAALQAIVSDKKLSGISVLKQDVFKFLRSTQNTWDIIYADPPYDLTNMQELADLAVKCLNPGGVLLLEHRPGAVFAGPVKETRKHGSTAITIFAA